MNENKNSNGLIFTFNFSEALWLLRAVNSSICFSEFVSIFPNRQTNKQTEEDKWEEEEEEEHYFLIDENFIHQFALSIQSVW